VYTRSRLVTTAAILALPLALGACSSSGTTSTGAPATAGSVQTAAHLDVEAFGALATTPGTVVLDVRTPEEFNTGHLQGARNVDFRAADFDTRLAALDRGTAYALYCHSGNRSGQALQKMTAAGFTRVTDLAGGITAWTQAGKQITTS
jgi:phage shock protein E